MARKVYESAIANWPEDERPREKLLKFGPERLTNAELLAILLRVGVKGKSAVDLARSILQQTGGLRALDAREPEELYRIKGLNLAKVAQIKAAIELGKRILSEEKRTLGEVYSPAEVFEFMHPQMRDLKKEVFRILLLNAKNQILEVVTASEGSVTNSAVYPREILQMALRRAAASIIFVHNHPSGSPDPSPDDRRLTRELVWAGELAQIQVLDHIIVGENSFYSFADAGLIEQYRQQLHETLGR